MKKNLKNKKGFTLVELVVVIAILAILVIIALPNVLSMFNQAKEDTFATETKEMVKIAQQQYLATFGKFTKFSIASTTECSSNSDLNPDEVTCKINKEAGNLTEFSIEFKKADGQVAKVNSTDGTYTYTFDSATDGDYDATNVKAQEND